jgi:hypothetical protein
LTIKAITKGVSFTPELIAVIDALPQVTSKEWSRSYLINQVLLNWLRMKADYDQSDLELIAGREDCRVMGVEELAQAYRDADREFQFALASGDMERLKIAKANKRSAFVEYSEG